MFVPVNKSNIIDTCINQLCLLLSFKFKVCLATIGLTSHVGQLGFQRANVSDVDVKERPQFRHRNADSRNGNVGQAATAVHWGSRETHWKFLYSCMSMFEECAEKPERLTPVADHPDRRRGEDEEAFPKQRKLPQHHYLLPKELDELGHAAGRVCDLQKQRVF